MPPRFNRCRARDLSLTHTLSLSHTHSHTHSLSHTHTLSRSLYQLPGRCVQLRKPRLPCGMPLPHSDVCRFTFCKVTHNRASPAACRPAQMCVALHFIALQSFFRSTPPSPERWLAGYDSGKTTLRAVGCIPPHRLMYIYIYIYTYIYTHTHIY